MYEVELAAPNLEPPQHVNVTISILASPVCHNLNLTVPYKPVTVSVYPTNNETLMVYVQYNRKPTYEDYLVKFEVQLAKVVYTKLEQIYVYVLGSIHTEHVTAPHASCLYGILYNDAFSVNGRFI
jgi:hypothetical protein